MLIIWILLLDAVDCVNSPDRDVSKPLLMPICDVVRSNSHGQVSACGKLESGAVRSGSKVHNYYFVCVCSVRFLSVLFVVITFKSIMDVPLESCLRIQMSLAYITGTLC